jgi:hypothetical protein
MLIRLSNRCIRATLMFLALALTQPVSGDSPRETAFIRSLPYAVSEEQVYKVRIERINGDAVAAALSYSVPAGRTDVEVSMLLHIEWQLPEGVQAGTPESGTLVVETEPGLMYELAARVDTGADEEAVANGQFWSPIVYRVIDAP